MRRRSQRARPGPRRSCAWLSNVWSGYRLRANKRLAPGAVDSPVEQPACSGDLKDPPRGGYRGNERQGLLVSLGVVAEAEQHSQPCGVDDVDLTEIQHDLSGSCRPQLPNLFCEPVGRREVKFAHRSDRHLVAAPHDSLPGL